MCNNISLYHDKLTELKSKINYEQIDDFFKINESYFHDFTIEDINNNGLYLTLFNKNTFLLNSIFLNDFVAYKNAVFAYMTDTKKIKEFENELLEENKNTKSYINKKLIKNLNVLSRDTNFDNETKNLILSAYLNKENEIVENDSLLDQSQLTDEEIEFLKSLPDYKPTLLEPNISIKVFVKDDICYINAKIDSVEEKIILSEHSIECYSSFNNSYIYSLLDYNEKIKQFEFIRCYFKDSFNLYETVNVIDDITLTVNFPNNKMYSFLETNIDSLCRVVDCEKNIVNKINSHLYDLNNDKLLSSAFSVSFFQNNIPTFNDSLNIVSFDFFDKNVDKSRFCYLDNFYLLNNSISLDHKLLSRCAEYFIRPRFVILDEFSSLEIDFRLLNKKEKISYRDNDNNFVDLTKDISLIYTKLNAINISLLLKKNKVNCLNMNVFLTKSLLDNGVFIKNKNKNIYNCYSLPDIDFINSYDFKEHLSVNKYKTINNLMLKYHKVGSVISNSVKKENKINYFDTVVVFEQDSKNVTNEIVNKYPELFFFFEKCENYLILDNRIISPIEFFKLLIIMGLIPHNNIRPL